MTASTNNVMEGVLVGERVPEIIALEERLRAAQLDADVSALSDLIADDLLFAGPDGNLATKAQDLDAHATGAIRFRLHAPQELRIRRVGSDCAVVSLRARLVVEAAGTSVSGIYRYTRIWAREAGGPWTVVAGHVSAVSSAATT